MINIWSDCLFVIRHPLSFFRRQLWLALAKSMNDRAYIKFIYWCFMRKKLNIDTPLLFTEKLQWLKLYDRKPIYHIMADKYDAKQFVAQKIGAEYVIPTLGIWNSFNDINFDELPDRFILKGTFDSSSYYICNNKSEFDIKAAKRKVLTNWKVDYSLFSREWPYKGLKHRLIAEPLLNDGKNLYLTDYKFYTFNGEPQFFYTTSNRGTKIGLCEDFFDIDGNHLELNQVGYKNNPEKPSLPKNLKRMVEISRLLANGTYHLRVDFYEVGNKLYVGELTFFDGGGFSEFVPQQYNRILGDWIKLPIDTIG